MLNEKFLTNCYNRVIEWNLKACMARYGRTYPNLDQETMDSQFSIHTSEQKEWDDAETVTLLLDGAIDRFVTGAWMAVLDHLMITCDNEESSIRAGLANYLASPLSWRMNGDEVMRDILRDLYLLQRFGIDVEFAMLAVLDDNDSKYTPHTDAESTVAYMEVVLGIPSSNHAVRSVGDNKWAVLRKSDLKILKPNSYMDKVRLGRGLDLSIHIPPILQKLPIQPLREV